VLAKETAILAPLALLAWESFSALRQCKPKFPVATGLRDDNPNDKWIEKASPLLIPIIPLAFWYGFHYSRTGFVFGNPEFFRYNVKATMQWLRVLLALGMRLWQVLGYLNLYFLTAAAVLAMWLSPLRDNGKERERIPLDVQFYFLSLIAAYVIAMALVGGAVLARYMLPVVPLVIIVCISTLRRRARLWRGVIAIVALAFLAALFVNPPHGFSIEDNLAYRDYILLHQRAEEFAEIRYPMGKVLTAWPASDEISRPYLGYVTRPMRVLRVEDFSYQQLLAAADLRPDFDLALVFSTKYDPSHPWFESWRKWQQWKTEFFGYHRDVPPEVAARILGGRLVYTDFRHGQWIGLIEIERIERAAAPMLSVAHGPTM
jgi:hypothetical protein